ncbi:putative bifunctional diguanylate cyclase/phosphodiesterase [Nitratireductor luteus]|uniref:putative bifunctional diguanylate cyclase/phosphodiesterase n=1 Tax=Nitratireductor luteus TaxID=2976980 RepID=UPI00223FDF3B|nr:EAL domain-containing protein [Nitratireductor luteus]
MAIRLIRYMLASSMVVLLLAAVYISFLVHKRQALFEEVSQYNVAFSASQGVNEFLRFRKELFEALLAEKSAASVQKARLRYEIFLNRLSLFTSGDFHTFVLEEPHRQRVIERASETMKEVEPLIAEDGDISRAIALTETLEADLTGLVSEANSYGGQAVARDQRQLYVLHWQFTAITILLVLCGFGLFALNSWQTRLLEATRRSLAASNEDLQRTGAQLVTSNIRLAEQNRLFETALDNMTHGLAMFDPSGHLIVSNRRMADLFGLSFDEAERGTSLETLAQRMKEAGTCSAHDARLLFSRQEQNPLIATIAGGRIVMVSHKPMDSGGWISTFEDITESYSAQMKVSHMARHDALTDLPNRVLLRERLAEALAADSRRGRFTSIMCIDLDNFKKINDAYGHPFGDKLLCEAARRLQTACRGGDTVSRVGGDEFIVVHGNLAHPDQAAALAGRLVGALLEVYNIDGREVLAGGSVGIAIGGGDLYEVDVLLRNADLALYEAKHAGGGSYAFYNEAMSARMERKSEIESLLLAGPFDDQFELAYQPITNLNTGNVARVEALLRWKDTAACSATPQEIVKVAEETGIILSLGEWVLNEACIFAAGLDDDICIAVNLSPVQFERSNIVETVQDALHRSGLSSNRLHLEITESLLLDDNAEVRTDLQILRRMGVRISLDDFGTGYSSLSYLKKFTVDQIKIDKVFIEEIGINRDHNAIVASIITMASSLGMTTVAEGVETTEQLQILRGAGCDEVQGYLLSKPLPGPALIDYLAGVKDGVLARIMQH